MKTKDMNMKCARHRFKHNLLCKHGNNKIQLCCNVVPKIGVEQTKCNMKKTTYLCTLLET